MKNTIRQDVQSAKAYHVQHAQGMVKLDAMESPYTWPETLVEDWLKVMRNVSVNRYPDPQGNGVKRALRKTFNIKDEFDILLGNGSDEIIQCLITAVAKPDACIMALEPSFVMFKVITEQQRLRYCGVPLNQDFTLNVDVFLRNIEQFQPELIFIPQPNNPTGNLYPLNDIELIIQKAKGLVVIDEAYTAYASRSHLSLLDKYQNVVVMRTLSKIGFAGLRLGYLVGAPDWLQEFDKVRMPYNINELTQQTTVLALNNIEVFDAQTSLLLTQREAFQKFLSEFSKELKCYETDANFILLKVLVGRAETVFDELKNANILVKNLSGAHPMLEGCLRITIGSESEMDRLQRSLRVILA